MSKKILFVILTIIITIGACGCMLKQNKPSLKEQVEKYMEEKYNEEFVVSGGGSESWNASYQEIYVRTERFPGESIMIRRNSKTGDMIDNYTDFLMKSDIEKVINDMTSEIYPKSKAFYITAGSPLKGMSKDMSVDEYMKYCSKFSHLGLMICVSDPEYKENKNEKLEQLRSKFEEKQYKPIFTILYVSDDKFSLIDDSNVQSVHSNYVGFKGWGLMSANFFMDENTFKIDSIDWEEIK